MALRAILVVGTGMLLPVYSIVDVCGCVFGTDMAFRHQLSQIGTPVLMTDSFIMHVSCVLAESSYLYGARTYILFRRGRKDDDMQCQYESVHTHMNAIWIL